jgi:putative DNA primase/helicase
MRDDYSALRAALKDRAAELAKHLMGEPNRELSDKREVRYGTRGAFALQIAGAKCGLMV